MLINILIICTDDPIATASLKTTSSGKGDTRLHIAQIKVILASDASTM